MAAKTSSALLSAPILLAFIGGFIAQPSLSRHIGGPVPQVETELPPAMPPAAPPETARPVAPVPAVVAERESAPSSGIEPSWQEVCWPRALTEGDTVAVVATGSAVDPDKLAKGLAGIQALGYSARTYPTASLNSGGRAGTVMERVRDLNRAARDESVDAIWFARGGSGSAELLQYIDWDAFDQSRPKLLVGYSDVTVLQLALYKLRGIISLSGPMVAEDHGFGGDASFSQKTQRALCRWLASPGQAREIDNPDGSQLEIARDGYGEGPLLGGNLSRVRDLLSHPDYCPEFSGAILVIEDVHEGEQSVRSMIARLRDHGVFREVNGVIIGETSPCPKEVALEAVEKALGDRRVPILTGLAYGHIDRPRVTLPIGAWTTLDARESIPRIRVHPQWPSRLRINGVAETAGESRGHL